MGIRRMAGGALASAVFLWAGAQNVSVAVMNRQPVTMPCNDFKSRSSSASWFALKGCAFSLDEAVYFESENAPGKITELYLPVLDEKNEPTTTVISSRNPEWIKTVTELRNLPDKEDVINEWAQKNLARVHFTTDISGIVKFGFDEDRAAREQFAKLHNAKEDRYVVLEHDAKPQLGLGLFMSTLGIGLGIGTVRALRRPG